MELDGKPLPLRPRAFLLEMVVIVGSILLAFALDAWWDTSRARTQETATLQSLHEDFVNARSSADFFLGLEGRMTVAVATLLDAARQGRAEGRSFVPVPDSLLALALVPPTFDPHIATLDAALGSNGVLMIRDPDLSRALSAWPGNLTEATEEQEASRVFVLDHFDPTLRRGMDIAPPMAMMDEAVNGGMTPAQKEGVSLLPTDFETVGVLARRHQLLVHGIYELASVRDEIERILELIERSLAR